MLDSALVIANPLAGRRRGIVLPRLLRDSGLDFPIWHTTRAGEAIDFAQHALRDGFTTVIAAGGDGTICEVINGVLAHPRADKVQVGILPLGTGNDMARSLGIGTDFQTALEVLKANRSVRMDAGTIDFNGQSKFFINVAGAGFDALVAQRVNDWRPHPLLGKVRGTAAYLAAAVAEMKPFRAADLRLELDGRTLQTRAVLCAIANTQSYGGGMKVAPQARVDDGYFDICLIHEVGRAEFIRAFPGVFTGQHIHHPKVSMHRARRVTLHSEPPLPILVDGDVLGTTPARFEILPRALRVVVPNSFVAYED